ncbi:MAG: hypothetical protein KIS66_10995 [Fimbriimonadaceae bacterium]|nr:hypothetical protein [Fimbriimonadaceae bacterium]
MRVRTTVTIEEGLLKQAKRMALEQDTSLSEVIERSLRQGMIGMRREVPELPSFGRGGLLPGVDLTSNASVEALFENDQ